MLVTEQVMFRGVVISAMPCEITSEDSVAIISVFTGDEGWQFNLKERSIPQGYELS